MARVQQKNQPPQEMRQEYSLLGDAWEADGAQDAAAGLASLEQYTYFDGEKIAAYSKLSNAARRDGKTLYQKGKLSDFQFHTVYDAYYANSEQLGQASCRAKYGQSEFEISVVFSRSKLRSASCGCPKCRKNYWYYSGEASCEYVAALLLWVKDYLQTHNAGDATDKRTWAFLNAYQARRANLLVADATTREESLTLQPRLIRKNGQLSVSFKVGTGRLFVVKQLDEFCANVRDAATATYGSSTQINHRRSNFTDEGQKWIRFIERIVQEEEEFGQRLEDATRSRYYYHRTERVGANLNLFGWRLDEFYSELGDGTVEYEDRDAAKKSKQSLRSGTGNPQLKLTISEAKLSKGQKQDEFHGVCVSGMLPELYFGTDVAYSIDDGRLKRSDSDFRERIEPLAASTNDEGVFSFVVGRNSMAQFYYQVLPRLRDIAEVTEKDPERFHAYLPPQTSFVFYLDAPEGDVTCGLRARYGEKEFSVLDNTTDARMARIEQYRDISSEQEMLLLIRQWMPYVIAETDELSCGGEEDRIYRMMAEGVNELLGLGEVRCTNRFRARQRIRRMKVSVGVSVSEGLLDLDITTEDVPRDELLDLLGSFREKKSYYRLKDGSYVDLEDQSVEMLSELMETMHLSPKEFVKGKMHLPLYRTLYLNRMLEENEGVYSDRDSRFREMVKGFKTVNDADFDVPKSLSRVMRAYQKNGYKWLRTLEAWGFGGILADEMGLGKTLQMIAVMLAGKEACAQRESALSLVVCPASLVFNWGEEFARFAPKLKVLPVVGTQGERRAKIASATDYDVLVTSYDLLKRDIDLYEDLRFDIEVIDEAQYIKNHTTAAAKAVKVVKSAHRFALTGTPIENRLSELWSIFDYLMPGFLYTYEVFRRDFETPIVKYQDELAMARLQKMTGPFILRRLKEDVLKDLPEKLEEVRYVRLDGAQQKLYDGQVLRMRKLIGGQNDEDFNKNKFAVLAQLTRLRQICCDPSLCFADYRAESAKVDACMELIGSAMDGGHRMLLFSQFTSMLDILKTRLTQEKIAYYTITGSTPKEERLRLVKEFNEGSVPVFLISLKAGGVGLNLTGANVVIHYDPWWNVAAQNQATDRAHRIGQTKKVTVYKLIAKDTVEEKILKLQETKRDLAAQVLSADAAGQLGSMSREELLDLLG
ncbi:MAG: SNF2 family helicase [Lachnospiraceae bacterium]|nr:SNF2 family helicase [Lachnospiraceae bacterium]